jgi:ethanolamine kinase
MDDMRPLATAELSTSSIARGIAASLANLHVGFAVPVELQTEPSLWTQLYNWLDQAEKATFQTERETAAAKTLHLADTIRPELAWLKDRVATVIENKKDAAVVFCHNDLLAANILYDENSEQIQLIDFEYGGVNYRAFDIANHFNEYAGGPPDHADPDYARLPDAAQQRTFIAAYLQAAAAITGQATQRHRRLRPAAAAAAAVGDDDRPQQQRPAVPVATEECVDAMVAEVRIFLLANHLYWGLWAVNQAATEGCAVYDYMRYAIKRLQQYWVTKREETAPPAVV